MALNTAKTFSMEIERLANEKDITHIEAVLDYCHRQLGRSLIRLPLTDCLPTIVDVRFPRGKLRCLVGLQIHRQLDKKGKIKKKGKYLICTKRIPLITLSMSRTLPMEGGCI